MSDARGWGGTTLTADEFLVAPKELLRRRIRWRGKGRRDYVEARLGVGVIGRPEVQGRLILLAHRYRVPPKYTFALIYRSECILRLDIEPGRSHINALTLEMVADTHWQSIPDLSNAVPDRRRLIHRAWLNEFLKRSEIRAIYSYRPPPHGEQLLLPLQP